MLKRFIATPMHLSIIPRIPQSIRLFTRKTLFIYLPYDTVLWIFVWIYLAVVVCVNLWVYVSVHVSLYISLSMYDQMCFSMCVVISLSLWLSVRISQHLSSYSVFEGWQSESLSLYVPCVCECLLINEESKILSTPPTVNLNIPYELT